MNFRVLNGSTVPRVSLARSAFLSEGSLPAGLGDAPFGYDDRRVAASCRGADGCGRLIINVTPDVINSMNTLWV